MFMNFLEYSRRFKEGFRIFENLLIGIGFSQTYAHKKTLKFRPRFGFSIFWVFRV